MAEPQEQHSLKGKMGPSRLPIMKGSTGPFIISPRQSRTGRRRSSAATMPLAAEHLPLTQSSAVSPTHSERSVVSTSSSVSSVESFQQRIPGSLISPPVHRYNTRARSRMSPSTEELEVSSKAISYIPQSAKKLNFNQTPESEAEKRSSSSSSYQKSPEEPESHGNQEHSPPASPTSSPQRRNTKSLSPAKKPASAITSPRRNIMKGPTGEAEDKKHREERQKLQELVPQNSPEEEEEEREEVSDNQKEEEVVLETKGKDNNQDDRQPVEVERSEADLEIVEDIEPEGEVEVKDREEIEYEEDLNLEHAELNDNKSAWTDIPSLFAPLGREAKNSVEALVMKTPLQSFLHPQKALWNDEFGSGSDGDDEEEAYLTLSTEELKAICAALEFDSVAEDKKGGQRETRAQRATRQKRRRSLRLALKRREMVNRERKRRNIVLFSLFCLTALSAILLSGWAGLFSFPTLGASNLIARYRAAVQHHCPSDNQWVDLLCTFDRKISPLSKEGLPQHEKNFATMKDIITEAEEEAAKEVFQKEKVSAKSEPETPIGGLLDTLSLGGLADKASYLLHRGEEQEHSQEESDASIEEVPSALSLAWTDVEENIASLFKASTWKSMFNGEISDHDFFSSSKSGDDDSIMPTEDQEKHQSHVHEDPIEAEKDIPSISLGDLSPRDYRSTLFEIADGLPQVLLSTLFEIADGLPQVLLACAAVFAGWHGICRVLRYKPAVDTREEASPVSAPL